MSAGELDQLRAALETRREEIAAAWHHAVQETGFVPLGYAAVRDELRALVGQAVAALLGEGAADRGAEAIGAALARLRYLQPEALGRTLEVLGRELVAGLPPETYATFRPRLAALLGGVAAGFFGAARGLILTEQEDLHGALLAAREEAVVALRESEARFRSIVETTGEWIWAMDATGRLTYTNPAVEDILGYAPATLLGAQRLDYLHPDDRRWVEPRLAGWVAARQGWTDIVVRWRHRRGGYRYLESSAVPVFDDGGAVVGFRGADRDVTERKQAEDVVRRLNQDLERRVAERTAELTAAQQRLAFLAEASSVLASSLDYTATLASVVRLVVPALADWCAIDLLRPDGALRRLAAAHADPAQEAAVAAATARFATDPAPANPLREVLRSGRPVLVPDVTEASPATMIDHAAFRDAVSRLGFRSGLAVPLRVQGEVAGALVLASGATGRRFDAADLALAEDLARRAAVTIENAQLYEATQEALAAREEFLSVAAHELKTPVTNVRGFTELALRQYRRERGADHERVQRALQALDRESGRLTHLVGQLLDVSRLEAEHLALDPVATDLAGLVRDVAAGAQLGTTAHTIRVASPDELVAVVDPLRIEQLLSNLLSNAIKYSPNGGPIDVELARPAPDSLRLSVRDRGIGVPAAQQARLFERYYRGRPGDRVAGLGLGLYISRQIATMHGGEIALESPEDGGSRFVVTLPAGRADQPGEGTG
ncbi:MAG TPA: ATP-binding protein [Thermomicrobiales bacterium]|nr:ATP-binding protein [Thermomicrobiales bacterium]